MKKLRAYYYAVKTDLRIEYTEIVDNAYICKLCDCVLSYNKKPKNILRHFYVYHKDIYNQLMKK